MTGADLLSEAAGELYLADPDAFTERRGVLAAQARAAGLAAVAKSIASLRKPTRSAWAVNRLVRTDPSVPARLAALGDELRAAERSLDGAKIRELSLARRELIDDLVRHALTLPGQQPASAALRQEVTATFRAALADPQIAEQVAAGTLIRAERWAGFGGGGLPALALVPAPDAPRQDAAAPVDRTPAAAGADAAAAAAAAEAAAEAARLARELRKALQHAEQAVAEADEAADAAAAASREQQDAVRLIEEQLAGARLRLSELRLQEGQAANAQRQAREALARLRE
jgi:hypothetical protein